MSVVRKEMQEFEVLNISINSCAGGENDLFHTHSAIYWWSPLPVILASIGNSKGKWSQCSEEPESLSLYACIIIIRIIQPNEKRARGQSQTGSWIQSYRIIELPNAARFIIL